MRRRDAATAQVVAEGSGGRTQRRGDAYRRAVLMVEENAILTARVGDVRAVAPVVEFVAEACVRLVG